MDRIRGGGEALLVPTADGTAFFVDVLTVERKAKANRVRGAAVAEARTVLDPTMMRPREFHKPAVGDGAGQHAHDRERPMVRVEFFVDYRAASGEPTSLTRALELPAVPREGDTIVFVSPGELGGIPVTVHFVETYVVGDDVYVRAVGAARGEPTGGAAVAGLEACGFRSMTEPAPVPSHRGTPSGQGGPSGRSASPNAGSNG